VPELPIPIEATAADIPAVVTLMNAAYRGPGAAAAWTTEADYIDGTRTTEPLLAEELRTAPGAALLLWRDPSGDLLGCVWLQPETAGTWYLGSLTIDPGRQNTGLGRRLLAAAEAWAREKGGRSIRMTVVNVRDTLLAWYERRGYALTGQTEPFPYDDTRFGIPRRPDLHFVVLGKRLM
jgi:GNAT superfamily N-acetyltransferase